MQWTEDSVGNLFTYIAVNRTNNDDNDYYNDDDDESDDDDNDDADDFAVADDDKPEQLKSALSLFPCC